MEPQPAATAAPIDVAAAHCPLCGHTRTAPTCGRCDGAVRDLEGDPIRAGRRLPPIAFALGLRTFLRGVLHVVLRREFVGMLWAPVLVNLVATAVLGLLFWLWLLPAYAGLLTGPWRVLETTRAAVADHGALKLTLCTMWLLAPPLLAIMAGAVLEGLHAAVEATLAGDGMRRPGGRLWGDTVVAGMQLPVRALAVALLALPVALPLALLPVVGMPLVLLAGAGLAGAVFCEPAAVRRGLPLPARLRLLRGNWGYVLGFGLGFQLALLVPFVNLLVLTPAAAVGSAALYFRFDKGGGAG